MPLRAPYAPQHAKLNDFLFAQMGVDESGMIVTVASAIARSGRDPWQEAVRIACLPHKAAIQTLAPMISQLSATLDPDDVRTQANRLLELLPKRELPKGFHLQLRPGISAATIWLMFLLVTVSLLFWTMGKPPAGIERSPAGFSSPDDNRPNQ